MFGTQEFEDLMQMFEKVENCGRQDREDRDVQKNSHYYYKNGERDIRFKAYMHGYAFGKSVWQSN